MEMETADVTQQNIDKIAELFPNCVTEIEDKEKSTHDHKIYKKGINFDRLRQMLSNDIVEGREAYDFTWVGKKASILEANKPIRKTLRPCINESLNWDTTENLYIEGDNLEVLKLLRESYLNKVKMIYIDPPYNTGNDFIYGDDYTQTQDEYDKECEVCDENGNRLFKNSDSRGRFHSDWCSMIYSRLLLARDLLREDGVIFISIDDHEVANLRKICDEVFGEKNFVATFIWTKTSTPPALSEKCRKTVEYVIAYEKRLNPSKYFYELLDGGDAPLLNAGNPKNMLVFPEGSIRFNFINDGIIEHGEKDRVNLLDDVCIKDGININTIRILGEFKWKQQTLDEEIKKGTFFIVKTDKFSIRFQREKDANNYKTPTNFLDIEFNKNMGIGTNETANKELDLLGFKECFEYPKPISLIQVVSKMICEKDKYATILDFFSGSATTAHAVMQLNAEDGGNRKFIMVQLPEIIDPKKATSNKSKEVAQNAIKLLDSVNVPHNICEIGKERIRRAGAKIKEEHPELAENLDVGFRVFKVDESNMKDVYFSAQEYDQNMLPELASNIKPDRTDLDLLFGCLLESGVPLSMPHKSEKIDGYTVHTYGDGDQVPLIACFEENIPDSVIDTIAKRHPLRVVLRDSCFKDSAAKINIFERLKTFSPNTKVRVI